MIGKGKKQVNSCKQPRLQENKNKITRVQSSL